MVRLFVIKGKSVTTHGNMNVKRKNNLPQKGRECFVSLCYYDQYKHRSACFILGCL